MKIYRKQEIFLLVDSMYKQIGKCQFPVSINFLNSFFSRFYNIKYIKYSDLMSSTNKDFEGICTTLKTKDARIIFDSSENTYYIYYNDFMPKTRCRWNILHELAHLYLGHAIVELRALNLGLNIPDSKQKDFEAEANFFVKCCVAPYAVVVGLACFYEQIYDEGFYTILRVFFGLSKESSFYIATNLSQLKYFGLTSKHFVPYISYLREKLELFPKGSLNNNSIFRYYYEFYRTEYNIMQTTSLNQKDSWEFVSVEEILAVLRSEYEVAWSNSYLA
jgi:hypothetical protein